MVRLSNQPLANDRYGSPAFSVGVPNPLDSLAGPPVAEPVVAVVRLVAEFVVRHSSPTIEARQPVEASLIRSQAEKTKIRFFARYQKIGFYFFCQTVL